RQQECTAAHVALAKVEERLASLSAQHQQLAGDYQQRRQELEQNEQGLLACQARLSESQRTMLQASAALAQGYLDKEAAERQVAELIGQRDQNRQERTRLANLAQTVRSEWQVQSEHIHSRELEASELRHRRDALAERLREDYQVDLAELYQRRQESGISQQDQAAVGSPQEQPGVSSADSQMATANCQLPLDPAAADEEIAELRRKLSRLGSVNLEALQELGELENRSRSLSIQFDDLTSAKRSLEEIISKINQDSKRLFF